METYKIIRCFHPSRKEEDYVVREGLTLEEAQAHCRHPQTRRDGVFFDCYTVDSQCDNSSNN